MAPSEESPGTVAAKLRNPFLGMTPSDVLADVDAWVEAKGLSQHREAFRKGALVARAGSSGSGSGSSSSPSEEKGGGGGGGEKGNNNNNNGGGGGHDDMGFEEVDLLSEGEKQILRDEVTHKWRQPFQLYFLCALCAGSAIVQGMDQSSANSAQEFYFTEFRIGEDQGWLRGLLNGAPYLFASLIGCWTNAPLNKFFGRRGTIFISCFISFAASFWMAAAHTWWNLLLARFVLGLAVGAKSSTTPVYAAESTPKTIRGALTMMWQMWTAFGIMLGFVVGVAFKDVTIMGENSQWRWILGSTAIPPMFVMAQVYLCPESPRWHMERNEWAKAYANMKRLRFSEVQAARDMYYAAKLLEIEHSQRAGRKGMLHEFFVVRRNRRAAQSAFFVMFMQQFCAVNVIAYYSTNIFLSSGFNRTQALFVSLGTGATNFLFAIPAIYTIDTFGRRNLLLTTFPLMGLCLLFTGFCFWIPEETNPTARLATIATGIYLFMIVYSPGEGPVPFTYSAEAFPLHIRDTGMSFATAVCWGFNFILSLTWPSMSNSMTPQGGFAFYAFWNFFGFAYTYFLLPETKGHTLEELDIVFNIGNREHAGYYMRKLPWYMAKMMGRDVAPFPPLYTLRGEDYLEDTKDKSSSSEDARVDDIVEVK